MNGRGKVFFSPTQSYLTLFKSFSRFLVSFLAVAFRVFSIHSGYQSFARCVIVNAVSQPMACLFHSLTVSSAAQMVLIFMKSNLPVYGSFLVPCVSQNSLPNPRSGRCSRFSSKCLIILCLTFRLVNPFWVNFCMEYDF